MDVQNRKKISSPVQSECKIWKQLSVMKGKIASTNIGFVGFNIYRKEFASTYLTDPTIH